MHPSGIAESNANGEQDIGSGRTDNDAISPATGCRGVITTEGPDCYVRSLERDGDGAECRVS